MWYRVVWVVVIGLGSGWLLGVAPVAAQDPNRLGNASLESPYYGQGVPSQTVPQGWGLWVGQGAPESLPDNTARDGQVAWLITQNGTVFMAAGYQQVPVELGDVVSASAWGLVYTCNDLVSFCAQTEPPYRQSDTAAGVELRLGIDPYGGTDPLAGAIQWSAPVSAYDTWTELQIEALAAADQVTVFLSMTEAAGLAQNEIYWDQTELRVTGNMRPTPTPTVTPTATLTPTPTSTPTLPPTFTPTPLSIADAAPELIASEGTLCFSLFEDVNFNGVREPEEPFLGGDFELVRPYWLVVPYTTDPAQGELCLTVDTDHYEVEVIPPDGYAMTTSDRLRVTISHGQRIAVSFGAAQSVVLPTVPASVTSVPVVNDPVPDMMAPSVVPAGDSDSLLDRLYNIGSWLVLGVAALAGGVGFVVVTRKWDRG